jgi:trimeric autotransporter adhesin
VTITGFVNGETSSIVNQAGLSLTNQNARNAGGYTLAASGLAAQNYDFAYTNGNLTISKADLTISAVTDSRQYTGLAGSNAAPAATKLGAGDSLTGLSQSFDSANAGARTLSVNSGYTLNDGTGGNNYNLTLQTASGSISKAQLSATANNVIRTYDGTTNGNSNGVTITGYVNNETSSVVNQAGLNFSNQNARNAGGYTLAASGLAAQNYDFAYTNGNLTISKANLTISAVTDSRQYTGLAGSNAAPTATKLGAGDTLTNLSQSFDSANAGARTLSVNSGYSLNDGTGGNNYNVTLQTATGSIGKAQLSATANNVTRTYDGTTNGNSNGVTVTGYVNSETSSVVNQANLNFTNQNARNAGGYTLAASGLTAQNYDFAYTNGNLTISKANLTISAVTDSRQYTGLAGSNAAPTATTSLCKRQRAALAKPSCQQRPTM